MEYRELLYNTLLYPKHYPNLAKIQRRTYLAYRRKILKYRILAVGLFAFLLLLISRLS